MDRKVRTLGPLRRGTSNPATGTRRPGGVARNVCESLAALGVEAMLFSACGRDADGTALVEGLAARGVDVSGVLRSDRLPTAAYSAVLEPDGSLAFGLAEMDVLEELDAAWCDGVLARLQSAALWCVDANLPGATLARLLSERPAGGMVIADPVSVAKSERLRPVLAAVDAVFPDRHEAAALSGLPTGSAEQVAAAGARIREFGPPTVVVSLGQGGVYVDDGTRRGRLAPIPPRVVRDVTGAGDALVAGYTYGVATGHAAPVRCGLAAASLTLESDGSVAEHLSPQTLRKRLAEASDERAH